jgi:D-glycero-alpha-D-manno-heptose 1-phosphate guanylyltransferase
MNYDALILAGGLGTRLKSLSADTPKPLMPVKGKAFIEYVIDEMIPSDSNIVVSTAYQSEKFVYLEKKYSNLKCLAEPEAKGTGGAILHSLSSMHSNPFLLLNGDSFCRFNANNMFNFHFQKKADITILAVRVSLNTRYGAMNINENARVTSFTNDEKNQQNVLVNAGVYIVNKDVFESVKDTKTTFSWEKMVLHAHCHELNIFAFLCDTYFVDMGIPEDYNNLQHDERFPGH